MKRHAPATMRNREPILERLQELWPAPKPIDVLEIASGTGEHAVFFAERLPHVTWHPTDVDEGALASIRAHHLDAHVANLRPPQRLDATASAWGLQTDAVVCINMIHISPWEATAGLFAGAADALRSGGALITYGPYRHGGVTAPSNAAFDEALRREDPRWGLRDVEALTELAQQHGLAAPRAFQMPANNHLLVFAAP